VASEVKIAYQIKVKNGALWEAAEKMGGVRQLAGHLGIRYQYLIHLMNMRVYPGFRRQTKIDWSNVEKKLLDLTGLLLDDIFPEEISTAEFLRTPRARTVVHDLSLEQLSGEHERLALPAAQDAIVFGAERHEAVSEVLCILKPKQQAALRLRFGLGEGGTERTLEEIGKELNVSSGRAGQIVKTAIRKLRSRPISSILKQYVDHGGLS
jgi:RNA polymerase sigma factor (sigma-70 family)